METRTRPPPTPFPKIISVDDHTVEPAARLAGPAPVEVPGHRPPHRPRPAEGNDLPGREVRARSWASRATTGPSATGGSTRTCTAPSPASTPPSATAGTRSSWRSSPTSRCGPARTTCRERLADMDVNHVQSAALLPDLPALLRPDLHRGQGPRARACSACGPTTTGWWRSGAARRRTGRLIPLTLIPLWDAGAGRRRGPAQRRPRRPRRRLLRDTAAPRPALHPHRRLGPLPRGLRRDRHGRRHAHRLQQPDAVHVGGRAARRRLHHHLRQLLLLDGRLADERQVRTLPEPQGSCTRRARSAGSPTSWSAPTWSGRRTAAGAASPTRCTARRPNSSPSTSTAASSTTPSA